MRDTKEKGIVGGGKEDDIPPRRKREKKDTCDLNPRTSFPDLHTPSHTDNRGKIKVNGGTQQ